MNNEAKERLHKILNGIYYLAIFLNFVIPVSMVVLCAIAISHYENTHWSIRTALNLTAGFSTIEVIAQIRKAAKNKRDNK